MFNRLYRWVNRSQPSSSSKQPLSPPYKAVQGWAVSPADLEALQHLREHHPQAWKVLLQWVLVRRDGAWYSWIGGTTEAARESDLKAEVRVLDRLYQFLTLK